MMLALLAAAAASVATAAPPPEPVMRYAGDWTVVSKGAPEPVHLHNSCVAGTAFITCEQLVDGRSVALLVFQPVASAQGAAGKDYISLAIPAGATRALHSRLHTDGDAWVFNSDPVTKDGAATWNRVLNTFAGPDRIHYDIQTSTDGKSWTTTASGDETRVKP